MSLLITALLSSFADTTPPAEIVYIPEGEHRITPSVNGKPQTITVRVPAAKGAAVAAAFQRDFTRRATENVRPHLDFDHRGSGPAAAIPTGFRYEPGKGIMCAVDWTRSGKEAIEGRDFSYFSPAFLLGDDGVPSGLPSRGPLGSLVNEPAFRTIPRIAASAALEQPIQPPSPTMSLHILAACGLLTSSEAARDNAESFAADRVRSMREDLAKLPTVTARIAELEKENAELKTKVDASDKLVKEHAEKRAGDLVTAAQRDGRIAPKDDKTAGFYKRLIAAGDADAEAALSALPKRNGDVTIPIVVESADKPEGSGSEHAFLTEARKLVTAGRAKTDTESFAILSGERPDLYKSYNEQFAV